MEDPDLVDHELLADRSDEEHPVGKADHDAVIVNWRLTIDVPVVAGCRLTPGLISESGSLRVELGQHRELGRGLRVMIHIAILRSSLRGEQGRGFAAGHAIAGRAGASAGTDNYKSSHDRKSPLSSRSWSHGR